MRALCLVPAASADDPASSDSKAEDEEQLLAVVSTTMGLPSVGEDQVLIAVKAASVVVEMETAAYHRSENATAADSGRTGRQHVVGHSCSGIVQKVADGVSELRPGDEVFCLVAPNCPDFVSSGACTEFIAVHHSLVAKRPANLLFKEAAAAVVPGLRSLAVADQVSTTLRTVGAGAAAAAVAAAAAPESPLPPGSQCQSPLPSSPTTETIIILIAPDCCSAQMSIQLLAEACTGFKIQAVVVSECDTGASSVSVPIPPTPSSTTSSVGFGPKDTVEIVAGWHRLEAAVKKILTGRRLWGVIDMVGGPALAELVVMLEEESHIITAADVEDVKTIVSTAISRRLVLHFFNCPLSPHPHPDTSRQLSRLAKLFESVKLRSPAFSLVGRLSSPDCATVLSRLLHAGSISARVPVVQVP